MRKVSKEIAKAFIDGKRKTIGKTHTFTAMQSGGNGYVSLHGNKIAWWENNHPEFNLSNNIHLCFSMCGWDTVTTRERLNAIFSYVFASDSVYLKQIKGEQKLFINDRRMRINENLYYAIRCVNGDVFLDHPIKKTG